MERLRWRALPLAAKITLAMTVMVVAAVVSVTMLSLQREQRTFETELEREADVLLATMVRIVDNPLFSLDVDSLREITEDIQGAGVVLAVQMYDGDGRIVIDTERGDVTFDLQPDPFGQRVVVSTETVYEHEPGRLIAARRVTAGTQTIGAIAISLPTDTLQQRIAQTRNQGILVGLGAAVAGLVLSLLISRGITVPLNTLTEAIERIAGGDFTQRVEVASRDELATVAVGFNVMAQRVESLIGDLEERNTEINRQVEALKQVNVELEAARQLAEEANQVKSQFLATMSHELRTPLNAINGFSQIMLSGMTGELTPKQRTNIERILSNGEHLLAMIKDILDLSKIESGMMTLVPRSIPFQTWIETLTASTATLAEDKNLTYTVEVTEDMPDEIVNDEARLRQIALNLISNAIKFTDEGEVKVRVQPIGSDRWQLIVSDTGMGIPLHAQNLIFEEFRQVDGSTKRSHEGTGLGLAIVRRLCLIMGGSIKVQSRPDQGSTFTVELPVEMKLSIDADQGDETESIKA